MPGNTSEAGFPKLPLQLFPLKDLTATTWFHLGCLTLGLALILCPAVSHLIEESGPLGHTGHLQGMALDLEFACYRAVQW